ncbi:MAG TPA: non-heme iron oxygenase ferredoxin subunit [Candidatus Bilamarchaeaceae archaeon]|nr:non-heme iron oxygenase ferredoxin subunit [Candidatus Bilamarchaeaceae archaeon]
MALVSIGNFSLKPGEHKCLSLNGKKFSLSNIQGKYYCIDNECTHANGPLCEGTLDGSNIICPWHGSIFDHRTGKVLDGPASDPVNTYKVTEKNGELFIELI